MSMLMRTYMDKEDKHVRKDIVGFILRDCQAAYWAYSW